MSSSWEIGADDLWQGLLGGNQSPQRSLLSWVDGKYSRRPWSEVAAGARNMTAGLRRHGVGPGTRVASVLTNTADVVQGVLAVWLSGAALASLPVPSRGMGIDEYIAEITAMCAQLEPQLFVLDGAMLAMMPEQLTDRYPFCSWQDLLDSGVGAESPPGDQEIAYIQYSSGSTSIPKGCVLTGGAIAHQVGMLMEWIPVRPGGGEVVNAWLPLSHDMGMFGTLLSSWYSDNDLYMSTPERFMMSPRTWFGDIAEYGVTITAGTNTGVYLSARGFRTGKPPKGRIDMRACIIGAERVEWETLDNAVDILGDHGLTARMFMPAYGLAEATLAVTATPREERPRRICLDAVELAKGRLTETEFGQEFATSIVSAGRPINGVTLGGLVDGELSQLRIGSPSLSSGYWNSPELTAEHFQDGTVLTNDLAFVSDGHLYLVGRFDDMINIAGRKVYARAIEQAIEGLDGVRRGCSTLVEQRTGDTNRLTLLLELDADTQRHQDIARAAATVAMSKAGVALDECLFLARGSLPKTPSGKIQRYRCRQLLSDGRIEPWATVELATVGL